MSEHDIERIAEITAELVAQKEKPLFWRKVALLVASSFIGSISTAMYLGGKVNDWSTWRVETTKDVREIKTWKDDNQAAVNYARAMYNKNITIK